MTSILKALAAAAILAAGAFATTGSASAGQDQTYHWAYPDKLKGQPNSPVQSFGVGSGIPPLYR
jgi:hypothetical protein